MSSNAVAFFIGLFGSIHCIGMCGPLAFAIPFTKNNYWQLVTDKLLYNTGRIITYTLLGLLVGFIGRQLWVYGLQQGISLATGMMIITAAFSRLFKIRLANNKLTGQFFLPINKALGYTLKHRYGHFAVGIVNGLLPCGFVYLGLAGAINTPSPINAAQYMLCFGLGTFPLMLLATISSGFATPMFKRKINLITPYLMVCLGFWFVLRGLNLDIPYLSPAKQVSTSICR